MGNLYTGIQPGVTMGLQLQHGQFIYRDPAGYGAATAAWATALGALLAGIGLELALLDATLKAGHCLSPSGKHSRPPLLAS